MAVVDPTIEDLRLSAGCFAGFDAGWVALVAVTRERLDPGRTAHRAALHRWLNAWGCRIAYAPAGAPDPFDAGVARWWRRHRRRLGVVKEPLGALGDDAIEALAVGFGDLSATTVAVSAAGRARTMGPTAAAKALHALRPRSVMPWDLAIAEQLHGGRDADAFAAHLRLGRRWAQQLLATAGVDEERFAVDLGRPGVSLAKLLDEHCWCRYTAGGRAPMA